MTKIQILAHFIDGITGGNMSTASAYIADISRPEERARNFTLVGMAWGLGLVLGPALGAVLGQLNLVAPATIYLPGTSVELAPGGRGRA